MHTLAGHRHAIRALAYSPGTGSLLLTQVDLTGNTGGTITGSNVVVTVD